MWEAISVTNSGIPSRDAACSNPNERLSSKVHVPAYTNSSTASKSAASISSSATLALAVVVAVALAVALAVSERPIVNADLMNVEQAASTMRCAGNTRPSTRILQSQSCSSRHIISMTWLREFAISSLATVTAILSRSSGWVAAKDE
jgi:hypothetical protein